MRLSYFKRQVPFAALAGLLLLFLLAACGSSTSGSPSTAAKSPTTSGSVVASGTTTETTLLPMMVLVGQPTAKLVSGHHTFEVVGKIKNGDSKQHDIYVQATLLNASGAIIGSTAFFNVDDVPGGGTESFTIQGVTLQPTWASVQVKVVGITENIGGSGDD